VDAVKKEGGLGFASPSDQGDYARMRQLMLEESKRVFKPEFLNRFDDIVVFRMLGKEDVLQILDIELKKSRTDCGRGVRSCSCPLLRVNS
jgi:ATP-dependent Clp protease ATP-binding subunit ClpC